MDPQLLPFAASLFPIAITAWAAVVDWRYREIPEACWISLAIGTVVLLVGGGSDTVWWSHLAAAALGLGLGLALAWRGGFGGGDVKLFAAVALWFGLPGLLPLALWTALAGLPLSLAAKVRRRHDLAYGPAIFLGTVVHSLAPDLLARIAGGG